MGQIGSSRLNDSHSGFPLTGNLSVVGRDVQLRQHLTDPKNEESLLTEKKGEVGEVRVGAKGG